MSRRIVAFLPCKGSSSRVPSKNTRLLDSKPLFLHTLEKLVYECSFIDEVVLDSESDEVFSLAQHLEGHPKYSILRRDPSLADNKTDGNVLFMNEVAHRDADIYVQILCTSPFLRPDTIHRAIELLSTKDAVFDSVCAVRSEKQYTWNNSTPGYSLEKIPNSVDLPDTIIETMGLYAITREAALKCQRRIGDRPHGMIVTPLDAVDINYEDDFVLADMLATALRAREKLRLDHLRRHLSSALLSDTLDELGLSGQIVRNLHSNFPCNILGRASTLRLRRLEAGEDLRGIYSALKSYQTVASGSIIVVENEASEFAYFGELNANIALSCGAGGAIIDGHTRDSEEVKALRFPVFSTGTVCSDVRGRATVDTMNCRIKIQNVECSPGDLVFGDSEGVVIIPRDSEREVINKALLRAGNENVIRRGILQGESIDGLLEQHGEF